MTEDLDNLLTGHHLLDEALFRCQGTLLVHHVLGAHAAVLLCYGQHRCHKQAYYDEHRNAEAGHHDDHHCDGKDGLEQHRHTLADHHTDGIGIVGIGTHDVAVCMGIKIFDWQSLHLGEHIHTEVL